MGGIAQIGQCLGNVSQAAWTDNALGSGGVFNSRSRVSPRPAVLLAGAEESLHAITGTELGTFRNQAERRLGQLRSELDYAQISDIIDHGLHEFIDGFQKKLNLAGDAIHETFFAQRALTGAASMRQAVAP